MANTADERIEAGTAFDKASNDCVRISDALDHFQDDPNADRVANDESYDALTAKLVKADRIWEAAKERFDAVR